MLPKDRVAAAFDHQATDKIPIYQGSLSSAVASFVLGREAYVGGGIQRYREVNALWEGEEAHREFLERSFEDACELCVKLDLDLVRTIYWRMNRKPTRKISETEFLFGDPDHDKHWEIWQFNPQTETFMVSKSAPLPRPTYDDLRQHAETALAQAEAYAPTVDTFPDHQAALERFGDTRAIPGTGLSLTIPREEVWLEAMLLQPDTVATLLDAQVIRAQKNARVMAELGIPYGFGGGDFCGKNGPLYSPKQFHEFMLPRLQRISKAAEEAGIFHLFATDGNIWPLADDLLGASGIHGFYELDRQYMDMKEVHAKFPHLTMLGGIRSEILHMGSVEDVIHETRTALDDARELQCCVIGCSNMIVTGTPEENFWAMMETLHNYR